MNPYSFLAVSVFYLGLPLSLYVLFLDPRSQMHRTFFCMTLSIGVWNLLSAFVLGAPSRETVTLWFHIAATASIFFFPFVLHFALLLVRGSSRRWQLALIYVPSALFHYRNWTSFFIFRDIVRVGTQWVFLPAFGSAWMYAWFAYSQGLVVAALVLLLLRARRAPSLRARRQAWIIFFSIGLLLLLGTIGDYLAAPRMGIPAISPLFYLITIAGIVYAMVRYRFLSITHRTVSGDIIAALEVPVVLTDPAGAILKVNRAAEAALGIPEAQAIGMNLAEISGDGRVVEQGLRRLLQGRVESFGYTLHREGNSQVPPMEVRLSVIRDEFAEPLGILLAGRKVQGTGSFLRRYRITSREWEVIGHAVSGLKSRAIAALLGIAERTVKAHLASIYAKLEVQNRVGLIGVLRDHGLFAVGEPRPRTPGSRAGPPS